MAKKASKDTILLLNLDIIKEIKANKKYAESKEGKKDLRELKETIRLTEKNLGIERDKNKDIILRALHNEVNMLSGKDYYLTISDGFEIYPIEVSGIKKLGLETAPYILNRFLENVEEKEARISIDKKMGKDQKRRYLVGYQKLKRNIERNIGIIRRKGKYAYEDYFDNIINDTPYPIFQRVNVLSIQINI